MSNYIPIAKMKYYPETFLDLFFKMMLVGLFLIFLMHFIIFLNFLNNHQDNESLDLILLC
jgi:hypothetical protein